MYEFSRALYRQVVPWLEDGTDPAGVLTVAEAAIERVYENPADADRLARRLFLDVRHQVPLTRQAALRHAVTATCQAAADEARYQTEARLDALRRRRECPELTRRGTPCRREPLANGHCPSHQHLVARASDERAALVLV